MIVKHDTESDSFYQANEVYLQTLSSSAYLMNPSVDFYFKKNHAWQKEIKKMREIALDCHLTEELKWGVPCYTFEKKNIVLIHVFKEYCAFLFFKGVLMKDPANWLIQQTENVQTARQIRFTDLHQIKASAATLKEYIFEAVAVEESGAKVEMKPTSAYEMPVEFEQALKKDKTLKAAFESLTPGRQRAYLLHFGSAKQSATRLARIEKLIPQIMAKKGLNDV